MIAIPEGSIELYDNRTDKRWSVDISPFLLGKYPVTQAFYFDITGQAPSTFKGPNRPVETISWQEATLFCNLLSEEQGLQNCYTEHIDTGTITFNSSANGYRLPTEAEWQYACQAGTTGPRYAEIDRIAWYKDNANDGTHPVGLKEPNPWGVFDMLGNVWEWCTDIYDEEIYGQYRILRGGGWADTERGCLATNRRRSHPVSFKIDDLGFRIAKNAT